MLAYYMSKKYYSIPFEWGRIFVMVTLAVILFFVIDVFFVAEVYMGDWMNKTMLPFVTDSMKLLGLENFKDGKLLAMVNDKFMLIVESCIKGVLSCSFIIGLFWLNILPIKHAKEMIRAIRKMTMRRRVMSGARAG
jgi:hypothetical protein